MKNKKLLAVVLLSLSLCFVSGAGYGVGSDTLEARRQYSTLPERYTVLVIPMDGGVVMFQTFLDMYPDAEIPEEFSLILPSEINNVDKIKKTRGLIRFIDFGIYSDFILSLLLTMAYQQDYEIEHVTNNYIILKKGVYEEELKKLKDRRDRFNEEKEKGDK